MSIIIAPVTLPGMATRYLLRVNGHYKGFWPTFDAALHYRDAAVCRELGLR